MFKHSDLLFGCLNGVVWISLYILAKKLTSREWIVFIIYIPIFRFLCNLLPKWLLIVIGYCIDSPSENFVSMFFVLLQLFTVRVTFTHAVYTSHHIPNELFSRESPWLNFFLIPNQLLCHVIWLADCFMFSQKTKIDWWIGGLDDKWCVISPGWLNRKPVHFLNYIYIHFVVSYLLFLMDMNGLPRNMSI